MFTLASIFCAFIRGTCMDIFFVDIVKGSLDNCPYC